MTDGETPVFARGDVVDGTDPFKGDEGARPWLILSNHEGRPFHGDQYIALTLTSKSWIIETVTQLHIQLGPWQPR